MDGVLVIDKPPTLTSHDVVSRVRRVLSTRRIGHIGTLDPMATGVLPLVVGRATRLAALLSPGAKVYDTVILLGVATDTYDTTGIPSSHDGDQGTSSHLPNIEEIEAASRAFTGTFLQQPPPFSAKKVKGVRSYRLARRRQPVVAQAVAVTVHAFEIRSVEGDRVRCRVTCEPGFYVRALAHDLGRALGCGACLEALRRERSGVFGLDDATPLDVVEGDASNAGRLLLPMAQLLPELPSVLLTEQGERRAAHGNDLSPADVTADTGGHHSGRSGLATHGGVRWVKLYGRDGTLLAVAKVNPHGFLHPRIVLV